MAWQLLIYSIKKMIEAAEGIFYFVEVPLLPVGEPGFQAKEEDEAGDGVV